MILFKKKHDFIFNKISFFVSQNNFFNFERQKTSKMNNETVQKTCKMNNETIKKTSKMNNETIQKTTC